MSGKGSRYEAPYYSCILEVRHLAQQRREKFSRLTGIKARVEIWLLLEHLRFIRCWWVSGSILYGLLRLKDFISDVHNSAMRRKNDP